MNNDTAWTLQDLVPHADAMCLLDRVLAADEESLAAELTIAPDHLFLDSAGPGSGVGAWVGIEYMAQAVAAWAGVRARERGEAPRIGFLLGSRRYACSRPSFALGERLRVQVRREFEADNGMSQFACQILIADESVASAQLTVFGPEDPRAFLESEKSND